MTLAAATNANLAEISNYLIYSSMAVYTLAFFAHIAEWTLGSRSKVARTAAALTAPAQDATADGPKIQVKKAGGTAVLERPKIVTRAVHGGHAHGFAAPGEEKLVGVAVLGYQHVSDQSG
ncbi:hypothetical protein ABZ070_37265, partial [Streptomyces sp. NPDC006283]